MFEIYLTSLVIALTFISCIWTIKAYFDLGFTRIKKLSESVGMNLFEKLRPYFYERKKIYLIQIIIYISCAFVTFLATILALTFVFKDADKDAFSESFVNIKLHLLINGFILIIVLIAIILIFIYYWKKFSEKFDILADYEKQFEIIELKKDFDFKLVEIDAKYKISKKFSSKKLNFLTNNHFSEQELLIQIYKKGHFLVSENEESLKFLNYKVYYDGEQISNMELSRQIIYQNNLKNKTGLN